MLILTRLPQWAEPKHRHYWTFSTQLPLITFIAVFTDDISNFNIFVGALQKKNFTKKNNNMACIEPFQIIKKQLSFDFDGL